ncbi:TIGR01244 family sulfur transferase [Neisseria animalis]|uniref:TIGR01244 family phosphatase n=1 Tax=Neisseria animalis TaxID=492 RepID=A0A5P3MR04_NEIAN|nr:TIGR01244 family sulfur transferase [Neisseria animalis]QEY23495.1 TIGR01244 family phosphatase [Neisseria animalis]ROW33391.1 TIGR01244 family phosphatase [Neisseria animalis]VEE09072.1 Uncharacterized protein conserved in bacteria [Neisseria animalis]
MAIAQLDDNLYIAPQIREEDVKQAVELGIGAVICNRPDGEEEGQPDVAQVQQWLSAAGIDCFYHQPVTAPTISAADVEGFQALLGRTNGKPVLAYCRTGTRCSLLWGFHQVQNGVAVAEVKAAAARAGVDLSNFEGRLQNAAEQGL